MKNAVQFKYLLPDATKTLSTYTATSGIYTGQYFDGKIRADYLGTTTYVLLITSFAGGNVTQNVGVKFKNGAKMSSPTSPGSRTVIDIAHGGGMTNIMGFNLVDTISSGANVYDLLHMTGGAAGDGTTWDRSLHSTSTYGMRSSYMKLLLTTATDSGLRQAPASVTQAATVDCGSITGGAFGDPSLSVSITPVNANSTLLVVGQVIASSPTYGCIKLQRDGSDILKGDAAGSRTRCTEGCYSDTPSVQGYNFVYAVPATATSSTTFKVLLGNPDSTTRNIYLNRGATDTDSSTYIRGVSYLHVFEIPGDE